MGFFYACMYASFSVYVFSVGGGGYSSILDNPTQFSLLGLMRFSLIHADFGLG